MNEIVVFVKPTITDGCCIVLSFVSGGEVCIHQAYVLDNVPKCIDKIKSLIKYPEPDYPICEICFDASVYAQEGSKFRASTDVYTRMYVNKKKFVYQVANQLDYVKSFVFRETTSGEYARFMRMYERYLPSDEYNIAMDILCDMSRYYRSRIR